METIIIISCIVLIIGIQLYIEITNSSHLTELLNEHYTSEEMIVTGISNLSTTEKLKYGVPIIPGMFMTTGLLSYFKSTKKHYFKKLDIEFQNTEHIIYVDVQMKNKTLIHIDEFETYNF
jgi:hypothetical protein